jgi:glutathione S-transferase
MSVTLHTCSLDDGGPKMHPCRKAHEALREAGIEYETNVFDKNRPMGLFTKGKRPELERMTGQEKLPVLQLDDGSFVTGSKGIVEWGRAQGSGTG